MALIYFVFAKVRTPKTHSYKCLESPIWDDPSTSNMVNVENHCTNLHHSTFIRFNDHSQINWVGKSLSYWDAKSWCCLLTHWLPMESIQFLIETIWRYQFRCNDLRKTKYFLIFFLHFWNVDQILNISKNNWPSQPLYFRIYGLGKRAYINI